MHASAHHGALSSPQVRVQPTEMDDQPCVLERLAVLVDLTMRPRAGGAVSGADGAGGGAPSATPAPSATRHQLSILVQDPICISASAAQIVFALAVGAQYTLAALALPITVPPMLLAPPPDKISDKSSDKSTDRSASAEEVASSALIMLSCPYVQLTILSAQVPTLPFVQLCMGDEEAPLSVSVEKHAGTRLNATETSLLLSARFYNASLFAWEPIIEPFISTLSLRSGGMPDVAVHLHIGDTLNINVSDKMLRAFQANLRTGHQTFEKQLATTLRYAAAASGGVGAQHGAAAGGSGGIGGGSCGTGGGGGGTGGGGGGLAQPSVPPGGVLGVVSKPRRAGRTEGVVLGEPHMELRQLRLPSSPPAPDFSELSWSSSASSASVPHGSPASVPNGPPASVPNGPSIAREPLQRLPLPGSAVLSGPTASVAEAQPAPGAVPSFLTNETGGVIRCWVAQRAEPDEDGGGFGRHSPMTTLGPPGVVPGVVGGSSHAPPEHCQLALPAGATKLLPFWDEDARSLQRDWHEDCPRELCVQLEGDWMPLVGIVVSQPNTTVLPLQRSASGRASEWEQEKPWTPGMGRGPPGAPRCVVCEVVLHERGTRLTIRSMLTLINGTSRTLIADLASDLAPLRHLGILAPADVLPIPAGCLEGGLRLIDAGVQGDAEAQRAALDAADVAEAFGQVRNVMWLSPLTCPYDGKPTPEEEATWRATFERPDAEHLVRYYPSCTLGETSGDLYLGSYSMHFKPKEGALSMTSKASRLLKWYSLEWPLMTSDDL